MNIKEYLQKKKKEAGLKWYWYEFCLLFDFEHRKELRELRKRLKSK